MTRMRMTAVMTALLCVAGLATVPVARAAARPVPLIDAVKNQDAAAVRALLAHKVDVDATEPDGTTALHWAAHLGDVGIVDLLLEAGATVKVANRYGATPFRLAAAKGHGEVIERMLQAGEDPHAVVNGEPVFMTAARSGSAAAVRVLLEGLVDAGGADVNMREPMFDQTALMWAAAAGNTEVVNLLLEFGADITARSAPPGTGLDKGAGWVIPRVNDPLGIRTNRDSTSWGIVLDGLRFTPLMWAARAGHIDTVKTLLDGGAVIDESKPEGTTSLILAIINNHWELAARLLEWGADPNKGPGYTALHQLAWARRINVDAAFHPGHPEPTGTMDNLELAKRLLAAGVDINAKMTESFKDNMRNRFTRTGATAFMLASKLVDVPLMKLLIANGADPTILNAVNDTPLMVATGVGLHNPGEDAGTEVETMAAVQLLLDLGEDIHAVNNSGETALHGASYRGFTPVTQLLVDLGAELEVPNVLGWTPLGIADGKFWAGIYKQQPKIAELLRATYTERGLAVPPKPNVEAESAKAEAATAAKAVADTPGAGKAQAPKGNAQAPK